MEDLNIRSKPFDGCFGYDHIHNIMTEIQKFHKMDINFQLHLEPENLNLNLNLNLNFNFNSILQIDKFIETYSNNSILSNHLGYAKWIQFWQDLIQNNRLSELSDKISKILSMRHVLLHGDPHHNNIWWRQTETQFEYLFFDFQTVRLGPIGFDLVCIFCSSPRHIDYIALVQSISMDPQLMNDVLLCFILYSSSLIGQLLRHTYDSIPHNFLVVLDIFMKFDMKFWIIEGDILTT